jgi:6-phosphogluconolactonase
MEIDPSHTGTPDMIRVLVFSSPESWATKGAEILMSRLKKLLDVHERALIALSGGKTPAPLYRHLAQSLRSWPESKKNSIQWFFTDERSVGPEDFQSNYKMAFDSLFCSGRISVNSVHRIRGESPHPDREALRYEKELTDIWGSAGPHPPSLDIALLGLGEDGHTASLFPGSSPEDDHHRLTLPIPATGSRISRISLSYRSLTLAKTRVFLVMGKEKREILARALNPEGNLPSQWVLREATARSLPSEFWIDREACPPGIEKWTDLHFLD